MGATRSAKPTDDKIRIVTGGVCGEVSVAESRRRECIDPTVDYKCMENFMEAGKARRRGALLREATSEDLKALRGENERLI